jgi:hypothetical protein
MLTDDSKIVRTTTPKSSQESHLHVTSFNLAHNIILSLISSNKPLVIHNKGGRVSYSTIVRVTAVTQGYDLYNRKFMSNSLHTYTEFTALVLCMASHKHTVLMHPN